MNTNNLNIVDEFIKLSKEADKIRAQIRETQAKYPERPTRPIKPIKPEIYRNKKPIFLKGGGFIYYLFIISLPAFLIILFFFNPENIPLVFGICATLPLIPLYFIYDLEKNIYNKEEKKNSQKLNLFNNQTKSYNEQNELYERNIINYNQETRRLSELGNVKLLDAKLTQIVDKIKPLIKEIDNFKDLSITDKFRFRMMTFDYDYLRDKKVSERPTFTEAELNKMYDDYIKTENIDKAESYLKNINSNKLNYILSLLKEVEQVQKSNLSSNEKTIKIKHILWSQHSASQKLWIGGILGTLFGLLIFGTGGIGIAGLGSAFGISGFLAGTTGGILISSLIQNFEKKKEK